MIKANVLADPTAWWNAKRLKYPNNYFALFEKPLQMYPSNKRMNNITNWPHVVGRTYLSFVFNVVSNETNNSVLCSDAEKFGSVSLTNIPK
jgi:hypothetical protein